jgi:hypothetical protein
MVYICRLAFDNIKDIIAVGFDPKKTFIFTDLDYIQVLYYAIIMYSFISSLFRFHHFITFFFLFYYPPEAYVSHDTENPKGDDL